MQQSLILPPTAEPVSVDEAICHLREDDDSAQRDLIKRLIRTARQYVEDHTRRALVRQTWKVTCSYLPAVIELPICPVRSVTSIQYVDTAGATQTLSASSYQVDLLTADRARIMPVFGDVWPVLQDETFDAVTVEFVSGYAVPFTTDIGSDSEQLSATAHPLSDGDVAQLWTSGSELPGGIEEAVNYYVVNSAANAFEVALSSGGAPITMTKDGKGQQFAGTVPDPLISAILLLVGHWYENREQSLAGTTIGNIPIGVDSLLMPYTSVRF